MLCLYRKHNVTPPPHITWPFGITQ